MTTIYDLRDRCVAQTDAAEIIRLRTELGITQQELAVMLGTSPQAVLRWEKNRTLPSLPIALGFMLRTMVAEKQQLGLSDDECRKWIKSGFWNIPARFK